MMFFVCVSCPFFETKPQQILHQNRFQNPKKVYTHDALTSAYFQCVENKMPVRKAAKLYSIPHTTLRDRLSGRVHIDTLLLHIETVLFSQILYFMKVECC